MTSMRGNEQTRSPVARAAGSGLVAGDAPPRPTLQPAGFRVQPPAGERCAQRQG